MWTFYCFVYNEREIKIVIEVAKNHNIYQKKNGFNKNNTSEKYYWLNNSHKN